MMNKATMVTCVATVMLTATFAPLAQEIEGEQAQLSYKMGYDIGQRMKQMGVSELDADVFKAGILDAIGEEESRLTTEQQQAADAALQRLQAEAMEQQREILAQQAQSNLQKGEEFLAENAKRDGVMVTDSGLQYEVITSGDGPRPQATDTVRVHYRGTLIDGTEFDSSYARGEPAVFPLNRVISGWTEGLQLMPVGSKYKFYIPSDLAYGGRNQGTIGPNSTLQFDVELLGIE